MISYRIGIVAVGVATVVVAAAAVAEGPVPVSYRIASTTATLRCGIHHVYLRLVFVNFLHGLKDFAFSDSKNGFYAQMRLIVNLSDSVWNK